MLGLKVGAVDERRGVGEDKTRVEVHENSGDFMRKQNVDGVEQQTDDGGEPFGESGAEQNVP